MNLSQSKITTFQKKILNYYEKNGRALPWRETTDPYRIVVSELMLQQTQVPRVLVKYEEFIKAFPDFVSLAASLVSDVLKVWQGLGYNRRALYLKRIAEKVVKEYNKTLPNDPKILATFPGIGHATAAAIVTYAFNTPQVFIETNIRTVYIHHFFHDQEKISDKELFPVVKHTVDHNNPRKWYWALMDYGTHLKHTKGNFSTNSKTYRKQSPYLTSNRRIRGLILKQLTITHSHTSRSLSKALEIPQEKIVKNLQTLTKEGFIMEKNGMFSLAK